MAAAAAAGQSEESAVAAASGEAPRSHVAKEKSEPDAKQDLAWAVDGYLYGDLRFRNADGESDLDLYTHVFVDARRPGARPVRLRFNGRLFADLAGDQQPGDPLRDFWDGFDHDVQARIYEAYVEVDRITDRAIAFRGGRQFLDEGVYLHFDGLRFDVDLEEQVHGVDFTVIAGVPVKFPESARDDNWLAGVVIRGRPTRQTRVRFSYYHVAEFFEGINDPFTDPVNQPMRVPAEHLDDDLLDVTVWHKLPRNIRLFGRFSLLNGEANELHLRARWFTQDGRWTIVVEWYQLFERLNNVTNDLSPFVPMLGSYEPFYRLTGRVTHRVREILVLQVGASYRALEEESDEGTFNHEYVNYYFTATRLDAFRPGFDLTLSVNGYESDPDNDVVAIGGHADYELTEKIELHAGVDYSLFKYVWFQDTEREDVWTYSFRLRWKARKDLVVMGLVSVDDDRFFTYTTVAVRATWRF